MEVDPDEIIMRLKELLRKIDKLIEERNETKFSNTSIR